MVIQLGRLERINLQEAWAREDTDFTPWLAEEANLKYLADTIELELELELEAREVNVGAFRADILCKNIDDGSLVLIENQIASTDHKHLGQLLTYASGLKTATIIWIASKFRDEHRAAMDWLNAITDENFYFFGLEVELWKIDGSPAAPKFNIVAKPNDWSKSASKATRRIRDEGISELQKRQLAYWQEFSSFLSRSESSFRQRKPYPQHWQDFSAGRSGFHFSATVNTLENRIGVELYISEGLLAYDLLLEQKDDIERELDLSLDWRKLSGKKASRIITFKKNCSFDDEDSWPEQFIWLNETLTAFDRVFRPRLKALDLSRHNLI